MLVFWNPFQFFKVNDKCDHEVRCEYMGMKYLKRTDEEKFAN